MYFVHCLCDISRYDVQIVDQGLFLLVIWDVDLQFSDSESLQVVCLVHLPGAHVQLEIYNSSIYRFRSEY